MEGFLEEVIRENHCTLTQQRVGVRQDQGGIRSRGRRVTREGHLGRRYGRDQVPKQEVASSARKVLVGTTEAQRARIKGTQRADQGQITKSLEHQAGG